MIYIESELDKIFLSYNKILVKLKKDNVTTKNNKEKTNRCRYLIF